MVMLLMVTMLLMQVEVGDQEEKVTLVSRVRLQETFSTFSFIKSLAGSHRLRWITEGKCQGVVIILF